MTDQAYILLHQRSSGSRLFVFCSDISALLEVEHGCHVFTRGTDEPWQVRETLEEVADALGVAL